MSDMPASPSGNNVVEFGRGDVNQSREQRIFGGLRGLAQKRLGALADALFSNVDDALFDLSERTGHGAHQAHFFDGMREIRKKRQRGQAVWLDLLTRNFVALERNETRASKARTQRSNDGLGLVEESDLEETLAITSMTDKALTRLNRPLYALEQRFSHLLGGRSVDASNNPVGPRLLSETFGEALAEFELELEVKLIVMKLFERHVLAALDSVYDDMNSGLVQAGVMPELRYALPSRQGRGGGGGGGGQDPGLGAMAHLRGADADAFTGQGYADDGFGGADHEIRALLGELTQLLHIRRGPQSTGALPGYAPAQAPSSREMLNALSLLQTEVLANQSPSAYAAVPSAQELKAALVGQIRALSGGQRPVALGASEDMIDIVGMIFDYAVQDRNLPAPIQALLGRLQIPYLKVALLDRAFVARHDHPARRLLDELAQSAIGWTEESDRDGRLIDQIRSIVERLCRDFVDDDLGIFKRLLDEFHAFGENNRKRSELSERRAAETARGREKLEVAQRAAAQAIMARIGGRELPPAVREILTRRWSNLLVLTHLRHGEESSPWQQATQFVDDLAWSVHPDKSEVEKRRLATLRPEIESVFRQGLQTLGLHTKLIDDLWVEIAEVHAGILGAGPDARTVSLEVVPSDTVTVRFASTKPGEEIVFAADDLSDATDSLLDDEALDAWLEAARALKAGTWMEFVRDDGSRERAKLLWISTIRALYLFVNRNGVKIAEKSAIELARELREQRAVILEQVALVDRALDAIVRSLKSAPSADADDAVIAQPTVTTTVDGRDTAASASRPSAVSAIAPTRPIDH